MTTLFRAGWQLKKVRAIMWFSLLCAAGAVWGGYYLATTYGLNPADGGELAALPVRLAWGIGVALLGLAFAAGMYLYGCCYVAQIDFDEQAKLLRVRTVGFLGYAEQTINPADILRSRYHHGKFQTPEMTVNAPWTSLKIRGRRWPLILDAQGEFCEPKLLRKLLG